MDIYGKLELYNNQKKFKDLKNGDVFYFVDRQIESSSDIKIYMRGGHMCTDKTAINLETGIMYSFDENQPVQIVSATMNVE